MEAEIFSSLIFHQKIANKKITNQKSLMSKMSGIPALPGECSRLATSR